MGTNIHGEFCKLALTSAFPYYYQYKQYYTTLWDGTKVYLVDGNFVRKTIYVDFTMGGHGYVYKFIPMDEVWIEKMINTEDQQANFTHEIFEYILMKCLHYGYDQAHFISAKNEAAIRNIRHRAKLESEFHKQAALIPNEL